MQLSTLHDSYLRYLRFERAASYRTTGEYDVAMSVLLAYLASRRLEPAPASPSSADKTTRHP
jgi:hypothetical protein